MRNRVIGFAVSLASVVSFMSYAADTAQSQQFLNRHNVFVAIREALRQSPLPELDFREEQIEFPAVRCRPDPQIQVTQLSYDPNRHILESRLRCTRRGCLPFYARVLAESPSTTVTHHTLTFTAGTRITQRHLTPPLLKAGDPATLTIITPAFHISLPVRCLQSGHLGETIRVRDPQNQRVLTARIESKTRLTLAGESR